MAAVMWNDEDIRERVSFSPQVTGYHGWDADKLALLYSAADVFVSTSWGEGFGLPALEAMACGTPVIAQDCSAISEVVGPGGVLIPPAGRITAPMGQDHCLPDIPAFTEAIEHLYKAGGVRRKLGKAAFEHASRFSWDYAAAKFDSILRTAMSGEVPDAVQQQLGPSQSDTG
jgi:glycosyltransferase involved in cell wall biosynthesis